MCAVKDDQSVVLDREPAQDTSHEPSGPRIRCPLCGWSPRKDDRWDQISTGSVCPRTNPQELVTSVQFRN
jgi:hypothetical protein